MGLVIAATQSLFLQAASSPDAWKFYPRLKRKWQDDVSGFMPTLPWDRRRLVLDLKTNRSLAPTAIVGGFASLLAFIWLLTICSQIERLPPLWVFTLPCLGSLYFGVLASGLSYWIQMISSRRRHLLQTAADLVKHAKAFGNTSPSHSKEHLAASFQRFLKAADRLGIPAENRNLKAANALLSKRRPLSLGMVKRKLIPQVELLMQSTYSGDFATSTNLGAGAILSSKFRERLAKWSSSALAVALVAVLFAWGLNNFQLRP